MAQLRPLAAVFLALFVLTGLVYPAVVFVIGQIAFPYQAGGSLIYNDDKVAGSTLIGQPFSGLEKLVMDNVEGPLVGAPGAKIVNVVRLNRALDSIR